MNDFIDLYCERLGPGFWAEPLNAITNFSFFIAAFFAYKLARRENAVDWRSGSLIILIALIGTGSFLFHTFATPWAQLLDVLPILFFQIIFIAVYAGQVIGWRCSKRTVLLGLFLLLIYGFDQLPGHWLNGSLGYAPALIFVSGLGLYHLKHAARERWGLLLAAGVFLISLSFRSLDMHLCPLNPFGLHLFWHVLNGLVLYLSVRAYILNLKNKITIK
jgi:hypothetical protein